MNFIFAILFGLWTITWVAFELFAWFVPWEWWILLVALFVPIEITGAIRKDPDGKGDTFSEGYWLFGNTGTARDPIGRALAWALASRAFTLPFIIVMQESHMWDYESMFFFGDEQLGYVPLWMTIVLLATKITLVFTPIFFLTRGIRRWLYRHFPEEGVNG